VRSLVGATVLTLVACTPPALSPDQIVPAFIAASQADTRTMRMDWQGTLTMSGAEIPGFDPGMLNQTISATFDFNGPDFAGTLNTGSQGSSAPVSYARVSGLSFVNYSDSGWRQVDPASGPPVPEFDPMFGLTAADVAYESLDTVEGRQVHRLRVLDPLAALSGGLFGQAAFPGAELILNGPADYSIHVDANGSPVGAQIALALAVRTNAPDGRPSDAIYEIDFTYTFSLWGEPVTISPPEVTGGGFDDVGPPQPDVPPQPGKR
jgi:hypothetical protein